MKYISSTQNKLIKDVLLIREKSRHRKKTGRFITEGVRELELLIKGGYTIETVFICADIANLTELEDLLNTLPTTLERIEVSSAVYEKMAYRASTEGVIAVVKSKEHHLDQLAFERDAPLILVAEAPEKPGNIGALLRTADAANLDAVIIANPRTDLYNPNIIRSGVGCLFTTQVATGTTEEIIAWLREKGIAMYCAALTASEAYHRTDFTGPSAIVVGTEATGLTDTWLEASTQNIIIPMQGEIDSMNVSVSAAIIIFEAKRQRNFQ
ncbi:TrmH family RNA methyltransferase [Robertkochia sediminum]|uniref:TrmH family RNA methyltransferase n=1 Tax=Robertkochia sediminum TaxID=2785326 RepID=UPI00193405D7|nr:RNA methyltransferase [Robertkochia sediminum]MBL7472144.1 RNA methyltransferase [Robertkochia sediminum]